MLINELKGIGPKSSELFNKLGIYDVEELLRFYPYRYNIYTPSNILEVNENDTVVITCVITSVPKFQYIKKNFNKISFQFETNGILSNAVIFNRPFYKQHLTIGKQISLIGKYNKLKNIFTCSDIKFTPILKTTVESVYHLVNGLPLSLVKKSINNAISINIQLSEIIPSYINDQYELISSYNAIKEIHNPTSSNNLKKARLKLKYEELFEFMFKINIMKYKTQIMDDFLIKKISDEDKNEVLSSIPFTLTNDQLSCLDDIINDFNNYQRLNRLVLGDVGSGKTIIAFLSILLNYKCGYQSALLAPTEVLAKQHFNNFINTIKSDLKVELLVGSLTKKEKNIILEKLANNKIDLLIGTHAMLEDNVVFNNLGLVVTDEQHRFGVNQRKSLQNKGNLVDVLYMSATPIPRTYALTIYGDMDISEIKQKPSGRKEIITNVYKFNELDNVLDEMEQELINNHQVYSVVPLIEDENETNLNDVNKVLEIINNRFSNTYSVGVIHGKMKAPEKEKIMNEFKENKINILISTTVIEVGVDVSNATMMVIFNAERFGLATLHQLRGRVGRNSLQSKCALISDSNHERLKVMEESNDGFYISQKDFELRGSGDLFGIRQSGDMIFKIADIRTDYKILLQCKKDTNDFVLNNIENGFRDYPYYSKLLDKLMNNN